MLRLLAALAIAASLSAGGEISGPATVISGERLMLEGGRNIRLAGLVTPRPGQYCRRQDNKPYPCGRLASDLLGSLINGRTVRCVLSTETMGVCRVGSVDLGEEMLRRGFAFPPRSGTSARYARIAARARAERRGMWQGWFLHPEEWDEAMRRSSLIRIDPPPQSRP